MRSIIKLLRYDRTVDSADAARGKHAGTQLLVKVKSRSGNMLKDRKNLLRFLRAALGTDGLLAFDLSSFRFWSQVGIDDELYHDADLEIQALYTIHAVATEGKDGCSWFHTHGFREIGAVDFDVLEPSEELFTVRGMDVHRGLAFAILEKKAGAGTKRHAVYSPGGEVDLVAVADFQRLAEPRHAALRDELDDSHTQARVVLCEPARGLIARWFSPPRPALCLSQGFPDGIMTEFSSPATDLMAERARGTFAVFRQAFLDAQELQLPALVKSGYRKDGSTDDSSREHLWFSVHACHDDRVDATLENQPFNIKRLKRGMRMEVPLEHLTDWIVPTPFGPVSPRALGSLRAIRARKDDLKRALSRSRTDAR